MDEELLTRFTFYLSKKIILVIEKVLCRVTDSETIN